MKKLIFPIVCCFISVTVSAQLIKPKAETQKKQSELDWFNCSFDQDSVYGAEVNKAYDYLKANKKKSKKRPVSKLPTCTNLILTRLFIRTLTTRPAKP